MTKQNHFADGFRNDDNGCPADALLRGKDEKEAKKGKKILPNPKAKTIAEQNDRAKIRAK